MFVIWFKLPSSWVKFSQHPKSPDEKPEEIFKRFDSSEKAWRHFCGFCGSQLTWCNKNNEETGWMDVAIGALSEESLERLPEAGLKPDTHIYWGSGVKWFKEDVESGEFGKFNKLEKDG